MDEQPKAPVELAIAHVLFIDIVGYSKLLTSEQRERQQALNRTVRETEQFRAAEAAGKLVRVPTGDGMVLAFFTSPDAPARCAVAISHALRGRNDLPLRMGIHSGPVDLVEDVNDKTNLAGAGVNIAQRVMNCGDAGHILLSARAADDLAQHAEWKAQLHEIGEAEVKHGAKVRVFSLYHDGIGNRQLPQELQRQRLVRRRRMFIAAATTAIIILGLAVGLWAWQRQAKLQSRAASEAAAKVAKSVAVLPFENLSTDQQNVVFADGVHREVLTNLAKIADLKVISRTSVMRYKPGSERNVKQIAQELDVAYIVEGSVQREAGRVRVTAELIQASNDSQVWAETYDGNAADVLAIQAEIAQRVSNQLGAKLSPRESSDLVAKPTQNLAAFESYIRARSLMETPDDEDNHEEFRSNYARAVELLEQTVARDPRFAAGYWALTEANMQLYRSSAADAPEYRTRAEAALKQAERLAPDAGETVHAQARLIYYGNHDFKRALTTLEQAAKLLPNNAEVAMTRALLYRRFGRWQEAYSLFVRETELNPHDFTAYLLAEAAALNLRWWPELDQMLERIAKRYPRRARDVALGHAVSLRQRGEVAAGNQELEKLDLQSPSEYVPRFYVNFWKHNFEECRKALLDVAKSPDPELQDDRWDKELQLSFVTRGSFDQQAALDAEKRLEERLRQSTTSELEQPVIVTLSNVKMLLGKKEDAIKLCQGWVEKHPVSEDALANVQALRKLGYMYLYAGDHNRALDIFAKLVQTPGGEFYGVLQNNPVFDGLRKDPRFQAIVEQAKIPFPR